MPFGQVPKGFLFCSSIDHVKRMREISLEKRQPPPVALKEYRVHEEDNCGEEKSNDPAAQGNETARKKI
ncbi:MAG: hypothetical protein H7X79_05155 [Sporomusaceae bacterium]|nr:hypothetical protein [Sporomusaceae bacterium]